MADPHLLGITLLDEGDKSRAVILPVQSTATVAQMQAFLDLFLDKLDNVTGLKVTGAFVTLAMDISQMVAPKGAPVEDYDVKNGGLLGFAASGTKYRSSIYIPGYLGNLINAQGGIDDAGATLALTTSILSGEAVISVCDLAGRDLTTFLTGSKTHRK